MAVACYIIVIDGGNAPRTKKVKSTFFDDLINKRDRLALAKPPVDHAQLDNVKKFYFPMLERALAEDEDNLGVVVTFIAGGHRVMLKVMRDPKEIVTSIPDGRAFTQVNGYMWVTDSGHLAGYSIGKCSTDTAKALRKGQAKLLNKRREATEQLLLTI